MNQNDPQLVKTPHFMASTVLILTIFVAAAILLWHSILHSSFISDDFGLIAEARDSFLGGILRPFAGSFFRPIISLTLLLDHTIWGLNPVGYHITNVVLHGVNAWLVFLVAARLLDDGKLSPRIPILAGLIFLLLPCHSEAVSWISGRTDVVASTFALLSMLKYLDFRHNGRKSPLAWSLLLFALAVLAKESMLILPFIIFAHTYFLHKSSLPAQTGFARRLLVPTLYCLCLFGCFFLRWLILGTFIGGYGASVHLSLSLRTVSSNLVAFPIRAVLPPMTSMVASFLTLISKPILVFPTIIISLFGLWWLRNRGDSWSKLAFLAYAFFLSLLPVLNLGLSLTNSENERYLYLPSVFVSIFLALFLNMFVSKRLILATIVVIVNSGWMVCLYRSNNNWRVAGDLASEFLADLSRLPTTERLFILNHKCPNVSRIDSIGCQKRQR